MNKVEYSGINIFYKEKQFFANFLGNIKLYVFPKLKLCVENPKVMVNKYVVTNCSTRYKADQKKASFLFHEDQELKRKRIYFVNRKDWLPPFIHMYRSF